MDPKDQPQFNPKIPISEVLKQEQTGFVPSAPKISNAVVPPASVVKIIKTFRSDAAEAVKNQQEASVAKIAIAEEAQRRERGEEIGAEKPRKGRGLLVIAIILIALGVAAIPTVQYILNQKTKEVPVSIEKTIVPFDHEENIVLTNATRNDLLGGLDTLNAKQPAFSNIEYRKVFEKIQDVNDKTKTVNQKIAPDIFATLVGPNMPSALARSFDSDYMYGIEDSNEPKPFLLFKTSSYQQTFANMLHWETKMIEDLTPIFNLVADVNGRTFTDQVIINKDVRAVTASDGTVIFLYGFLDNQTLIITTNPQTFQDINTRYIATQFVQ